VLLCLPKDIPKAKSSNTPHRVPVFLSLNFRGNHAEHAAETATEA
jgi:hypothetical protein